MRISDWSSDVCSSDLARPQATAAFIRFLAEQAIHADALYILGDLFEAWLGDDDDSPLADTVAQALRALSQHGTAIYFMRGNRDFLLATDYARRCGMRLLPAPSVFDLYGSTNLLSHGEIVRAPVRTPVTNAQLL